MMSAYWFIRMWTLFFQNIFLFPFNRNMFSFDWITIKMCGKKRLQLMLESCFSSCSLAKQNDFDKLNYWPNSRTPTTTKIHSINTYGNLPIMFSIESSLLNSLSGICYFSILKIYWEKDSKNTQNAKRCMNKFCYFLMDIIFSQCDAAMMSFRMLMPSLCELYTEKRFATRYFVYDF